MASSAPAWLKFLFVFFMAICCSFLGMFLSKFFIPKSAGLAGGAMVLGYGLLGLLVGIVLGFYLKNRLSRSNLTILTSILVVGGLASLAWFYSKYRASQQESQRQIAEMKKLQQTHKPTAQAQPIPSIQQAPFYGHGIAKPYLKENTTLTFYESASNNEAVEEIKFMRAAHGDIIIEDHPSWLRPANIKLDYQILCFKVFDQSNSRVLLTVDEKTGKKYWVDKNQIEILPWEDFLLSVFAVEPLDWQNNPIRKNATTDANIIPGINRENTLRPLKFNKDWMEVEILDKNNKVIDRGWLRWRSEEKLIVDYSLLS